MAIIDRPASLDRRMNDVLDRMPPGPFSRSCLVDHATGLNAVNNQCQVHQFLERMVANGVVLRLDDEIDLYVLASSTHTGRV